MPKKVSQEQFIDRAKKIHDNKYDYSLVNYINSTEEIVIICPNHGEFKQKPFLHTRGGGCRKCGIKEGHKKTTLTIEKFIEKAKEKHGEKYDYSKVDLVNTRTKIEIICPLHGVFRATPLVHYKAGCKECGKIIKTKKLSFTTEEFIEKSLKVHDNKYSYEKAEYTNNLCDVTITCPIHGDFTQKSGTHLAGRGCVKCAYLTSIGFTRTNYIKKAKGRLCTFYTIRCFNEEEEFYKIGITMNGVRKRYYEKKRMPYNYEIISEVFGEAGEIWDMEKEQMKKLKSFHYQPKIDFGGSIRECFTQYTINEK